MCACMYVCWGRGGGVNMIVDILYDVYKCTYIFV